MLLNPLKIQIAKNRYKETQKLVMEKLKSIENERSKLKENESVDESDDDSSDSCISIKDSSSEEEADLVSSLTVRASQKKNQKFQKAGFNNKKNAKNFKKYQKPEMPKSFQRRNKSLMKRKKKEREKKKRFFTSKWY